MGEGYMFEFIKDEIEREGGRVKPVPSKSFLDYIKQEGELRKNFDELVDTLKRLKTEMLRYEVVTMALYAQNILYKKDKDGFWKICNYR
jgi:hypothetical protein